MSREFPETQLSVFAGLQGEDEVLRERSFERLLQAYYKPAYKHLRLKWRKSPEETEDLAQGFFLRVTERSTFSAFEPTRGRFRTFLRTCLDNFVLHQEEARQRLKRGSAFRVVSSDASEAEHELVANAGESVVDVFDREFVRNLMQRSVAQLGERMTASGRPIYFEVLKRYDLCDGTDEPTYASVAAELGIKSSDVTNYLHAARKELKLLVLDVLRDLTASQEEFELEAAELGIIDARALGNVGASLKR